MTQNLNVEVKIIKLSKENSGKSTGTWMWQMFLRYDTKARSPK
jgi:hypothetical protein